VASKNYQSNRPAVNAAMKASERAALTAIGEFVEGAAKLNAPVALENGGNLRDSIGYRVNDSDKSVSVGAAAEYAYWVEKGTSKMSAQPYLSPAFEGNMSVIRALVQGAWKM